jgi:ornithine--oxo-acid transaminase
LDRDLANAAAVATRLLQAGVLTKDTHRNTIRFAPPLIIEKSQIDWVADRVAEVLDEFARAEAHP